MISAAFSPDGPPHRLVELWLDGGFDLVSSSDQIEELRRVLRYQHVRKRVHPEEALALVTNIAAVASLSTPVSGVDVSPDPDDNIILATAIAGEADLVVSGDRKGMLDLGEVRGIPIVGPAEALRILQKRSGD